jgi:hypothetical protein
MDNEAHRDQTIDYLLDVGLIGPLLHYYKHELIPEIQLWHRLAVGMELRGLFKKGQTTNYDRLSH